MATASSLRANPFTELSSGWQYRWGDSPKTQSGEFAWAVDKNPSGWENHTYRQQPRDRNRRNNLWQKIRLPEIPYADPAVYLYSVDYNFEAFLDGKPIYRFGEISADGRGSFVGWPWHLIRLPDNYGGKTLSLRVYSDYDEIGIYGEALLGSRGDFILFILRKDMDQVFLGLIAIIFSVYPFIVFLRHRDQLSYLFIGLFCVAIGIVYLNDSQTRHLFWPSPQIWFYAGAFAELTAVLFLLGFYMMTLDARYRSFLRIVVLAHIPLVFLAPILIYTQIALFLSTFKYYEALEIIDLLIMTGLTFRTAFQGNVEGRILSVGFALGLPLFAHDILVGPFSLRLGHWGISLILLSQIWVMVRRQIETRKQVKELEKLQQEIRLATEIQMSILPQSTPLCKGLSVEVRYIPMTSIGGDFYDFHTVEDHQLGILLADVSGHGIPAAMGAAMVKMAFSASGSLAPFPSRVLEYMKLTMAPRIGKQFVTACYAFINTKEHTLIVASAGHPPLLLLKNRGKEMIELKPQGRLIAQLPRSSEYGIEKVEIERGDRILIYTDGVVELRDQAGRAFGEERLMQLFREGAEISSGKFADSLLASLRKWSGENTGFQDDVCYLLLDVA